MSWRKHWQCKNEWKFTKSHLWPPPSYVHCQNRPSKIYLLSSVEVSHRTSLLFTNLTTRGQCRTAIHLEADFACIPSLTWHAGRFGFSSSSPCFWNSLDMLPHALSASPVMMLIFRAVICCFVLPRCSLIGSQGFEGRWGGLSPWSQRDSICKVDLIEVVAN